MNTTKKLSAVILLLGGVLWFAGAEVQAQGVDFNINTQLNDLRSDGTNKNPGFDPCRGGTRSAAGVCTGLAENGIGVALLDPDHLKTLFPSLGPGAVTDNMFGKISGPDLGPDNNAATTGDNVPVTACGKNTSNTTLAGLNCGDLRFDPFNQGQTLPTGQNTLVTPAPLLMNTQFIADFCANGGADCNDGASQVSAGHAGFSISNDFSFQVINPCTVNPSGTLTPVGCGATGTAAGTDRIRQVTALKTTGIGTEAAPLSGDQVFSVETTWATNAGNPSTANIFAAPPNLSVAWTQFISDPDQSGTGSGAFTQDISGSFIYNSGGSVISAQYPSGRTQTERSTGAVPIGESLAFGP